MTNLPLDRKLPAKPGKKRPLPYERRAQKPGAGIVAPGERPPAGVKRWPKWTLAAARRAGQIELFGDHYSVDPWEEEVKRAKRRRKRRERQPGVFVP